MRRSLLAVTGLAFLAGACGGGSSSPTTPTPTVIPTPVPTPTPTPNPAPVILDSSNFDAQVLRATKPAMVEFHSPT